MRNHRCCVIGKLRDPHYFHLGSLSSVSDNKNEPKQTTRTGVEIPVPKRDDFLRDLKKAAPAPAKGSTKKP
jgi:hypothetical protein